MIIASKLKYATCVLAIVLVAGVLAANPAYAGNTCLHFYRLSENGR